VIHGSPRRTSQLEATLWAECQRAYLTGDSLIAALYRFFALEALLGDKSEG
jgi:hypothetical protein